MKIQATDFVTWLLNVHILAQTEKQATEFADFLSLKAEVHKSFLDRPKKKWKSEEKKTGK